MDENFNNNENNQQNGQQFTPPSQQPDYTQQYNQQPQQPDYAQQYNQQPQQYNEPYYNQQYPQYNEPLNDNSRGFAIASLVLGIISFFCCGSICSILGLIFGIISKKRKSENNGMATAGIVLSIIALVLWLIYFIIILFVPSISSIISGYENNLRYYY